jgi:hypothetical protein
MAEPQPNRFLQGETEEARGEEMPLELHLC